MCTCALAECAPTIHTRVVVRHLQLIALGLFATRAQHSRTAATAPARWPVDWPASSHRRFAIYTFNQLCTRERAPVCCVLRIFSPTVRLRPSAAQNGVRVASTRRSRGRRRLALRCDDTVEDCVRVRVCVLSVPRAAARTHGLSVSRARRHCMYLCTHARTNGAKRMHFSCSAGYILYRIVNK